MTSFAVTTVSGVKHLDSRDGAALYLSDTIQCGQPDVKMLAVAHAGCAVSFRSNLPGPSRRIVVEPIEVPAQPVQVPETTPAEPAGHPEDEPVPAR